MSRDYVVSLPVYICFEDDRSITVTVDLADAGDSGMLDNMEVRAATRRSDVERVENLSDIHVKFTGQ